MLLLGFCLDTHDTDGWMRGNLNEQLHKITYGRSQGLEHVEREETEKRRLEEMRSETYADERQERERQDTLIQKNVAKTVNKSGTCGLYLSFACLLILFPTLIYQ